MEGILLWEHVPIVALCFVALVLLTLGLRGALDVPEPVKNIRSVRADSSPSGFVYGSGASFFGADDGGDPRS